MGRITPNHITALRLFLCTPLACYFIANGHLELAFATMIFAEFTDYLDGQMARRKNQVTNLGKFFDPLCDSVFHMTVWMSLLSVGWAPLYLVVVFFARDAIVSTIRSCLAKEGIVLAARKSGKVKAVSQAVAQLTIVLMHILLIEGALETVAIWGAVVVTLFSLLDYGFCFFCLTKTFSADVCSEEVLVRINKGGRATVALPKVGG